MTEALPPGSAIGILGGGQLGRMLSVAASRLGLRCHIYEPAPNPPAGQVAEAVTTADYTDEQALREFANSVDVITYEFENIPAGALDILEGLKPVRPGRKALEVSQDRLTEKRFLSDLGLATAPFADVDSAAKLAAALETIGTPSILKTRRFGYDGKGQVRIGDDSDPSFAFSEISGAPAVLEGLVNFTHEVSVIAARSIDGRVVAYDPGENEHRDGILARSRVPARLSLAQQTDAVLIAGRILNALDYVGVMGVELFVTEAGLVVNEIAPRVHNSGHWTQDACLIDQFEQHIRAVAGWSLGDGSRHSDAEMVNLIGDDVNQVPQLAKDPGVVLHLYGKAEACPGRKMGHYNRISPIPR